MKVIGNYAFLGAAVLALCVGCGGATDDPTVPVERLITATAAGEMEMGNGTGPLAHLFGKSITVSISMGDLVESHRAAIPGEEERFNRWAVGSRAPIVEVLIEGDLFLERVAGSFSNGSVRIWLNRSQSQATTSVRVSLTGDEISEGTFFMSFGADVVLPLDADGFPVLIDFQMKTGGGLLFARLDLQYPGRARELIFGDDAALTLAGIE